GGGEIASDLRSGDNAVGGAAGEAEDPKGHRGIVRASGNAASVGGEGVIASQDVRIPRSVAEDHPAPPPAPAEPVSATPAPWCHRPAPGGTRSHPPSGPRSPRVP